MADKALAYDPTDAASIFAYSEGLLHHTLYQAVNNLDPTITKDILKHAGKGGLGQMVEKYYFGYEPNSNPTADFEEAGVELKTTPLKELKTQTLGIKERLVCDMIDYCTVVDETFEESTFFKKSVLMLIIFYLHIKGADLCDLEFLYSVLWQIKEKDLLIIRQDYELIVNKIRAGKAHELSEGDTMYLGACRKGQKGDSLRKQPFSEFGAPRRAFSLKTSYMRTILDFVQKSGSDMATNTDVDIKALQLVKTKDLKNKTFEQILIDRFAPYIGLDYRQIGRKFKTTISPREKSKYATAAKRIMLKGLTRFDEADEIQKAGIIAKTIRVQKNGTIKESMSFENINYEEVLNNDEWTDSRWYEICTSKFMFIIYREVDDKPKSWGNEPRYVLDRLVFWTMPNSDLDIAEKYWANIRQNVLADTITDESNTYWRQKDHNCFHVRPKAAVSAVKHISPISGIAVPKKAYWFNGEYVSKIIREIYGPEWAEKFKAK